MRRLLLLLNALLLPIPLFAANHCVILQYHHFSTATPASTSVTPTQFDAHLDYLANNDFNVMALPDVALALYHQLELPERCVAFSVDDAYISVYENAWPRLHERGWPLTVFVNSAAVDRGGKHLMTWEQMRTMAKQGVTFENHGHAHIHMIRKQDKETESDWLKRITSDIQIAQQRINQELGQKPTLFAWPYGEYNQRLAELIRDLDFTGFGQQSGPAWPDGDFAYLPRFPMAAQFADLKGFITKVNTLPLPIVSVVPVEPVLPIGERRPALNLRLAPGKYTRDNLRCYVSGSDQVEMTWSDSQADSVQVAPLFDLQPGRHRTNCTMPSNQKGRFHWYSHNWIVPKPDGSWYAEY